MIRFWEGEPIKELSRERLEEAFEWLADQYEAFTSPKAIRQRALGAVAMMKRNET